MSRAQLDYKLKGIRDEMLDLGEAVSKLLRQSLSVLTLRSPAITSFVSDDYTKIRRRRLALEENILVLIATEQPILSHDLRFAASVIIIAGELERMAGHARRIARSSEALLKGPLDESLLKLEMLAKMSELTQQMLGQTLEALSQDEASRARSIAQEDDRLDSLHTELTGHYLQLVNTQPTYSVSATYLSWIIHSLERIGDRATTICERVVFIVSGELPTLSQSAAQSQLEVQAGAGGLLNAALELED